MLDAAAQGASSASFLVLNIVANLIAFLAFIAFLNGIISWLGGLLGAPYITFEVLNRLNLTVKQLTEKSIPSILSENYSSLLRG